MTGRPGRPAAPPLPKARAAAIGSAARRVERARRELAKADAALVEQLREGRKEGATLRQLGDAAGLVVSRVYALTTGAAE